MASSWSAGSTVFTSVSTGTGGAGGYRLLVWTLIAVHLINSLYAFFCFSRSPSGLFSSLAFLMLVCIPICAAAVSGGDDDGADLLKRETTPKYVGSPNQGSGSVGQQASRQRKPKDCARRQTVEAIQDLQKFLETSPPQSGAPVEHGSPRRRTRFRTRRPRLGEESSVHLSENSTGGEPLMQLEKAGQFSDLLPSATSYGGKTAATLGKVNETSGKKLSTDFLRDSLLWPLGIAFTLQAVDSIKALILDQATKGCKKDRALSFVLASSLYLVAQAVRCTKRCFAHSQ